VVTSGVFVPLRTSEEIFARPTLTDAFVIAKSPDDVPGLAEQIRQQFRLNTGIFVEESYSRYARQVRDFRMTLSLFRGVGILAGVLGCAVAAALLHDVYQERRYQYAILAALGFGPIRLLTLILAPGLLAAGSGMAIGFSLAAVLVPKQFQMPALLANLGAVTPRFGGAVVIVVIALGITAVAAAMAQTIWILARRPLARAFRKNEP
jgi:ABC-type lipoprotein release transport system permease subunit